MIRLTYFFVVCCFFIPSKIKAGTDSLAVQKLIEQGDEMTDTDSEEACCIFDKAKKLADKDELRPYYAQKPIQF